MWSRANGEIPKDLNPWPSSIKPNRESIRRSRGLSHVRNVPDIRIFTAAHRRIHSNQRRLLI